MVGCSPQTIEDTDYKRRLIKKSSSILQIVHADIIELYSRSKLPWGWCRLLIISMLGKSEREESVYRNQQHGIGYIDNKLVTFSDINSVVKWKISAIIPFFKKKSFRFIQPEFWSKEPVRLKIGIALFYECGTER